MTEGFEKDLTTLTDIAAAALWGAEIGEGIAVVQLTARHTVLHEILGLYEFHKPAQDGS